MTILFICRKKKKKKKRRWRILGWATRRTWIGLCRLRPRMTKSQWSLQCQKLGKNYHLLKWCVQDEIYNFLIFFVCSKGAMTFLSFLFGPLWGDIFLTTFYGLYFSHHYTYYTLKIMLDLLCGQLHLNEAFTIISANIKVCIINPKARHSTIWIVT